MMLDFKMDSNIESIPSPIYVVAPDFNEDMTQLIAIRIADKSKVEFVSNLNSNVAALVVEIGGIWDRSNAELAVEDKTRTKIFKTILDLYFDILDWTSNPPEFRTPISHMFNSNYVRLELTNRLRYSKDMQNLLVLIVSNIIEELKSVL